MRARLKNNRPHFEPYLHSKSHSPSCLHSAGQAASWELKASSLVPLQSFPSQWYSSVLHSGSQMPSPTYVRLPSGFVAPQFLPMQQKQSGPHLPRITPLHSPPFPVHRPPTFSQCCASNAIFVSSAHVSAGPPPFGCGMRSTVPLTLSGLQSQNGDTPSRVGVVQSKLYRVTLQT